MKKVKITGLIASKLVSSLAEVGIDLDWNTSKILVITVEDE